MAQSHFYGFVTEGYWYSLPLGNRKIWIPKGTVVYIPRAVKDGIDLNVHKLVVKYPEKLQSDSTVTYKDAINFGVFVEKERVTKVSEKEQLEFAGKVEDMARDLRGSRQSDFVEDMERSPQLWDEEVS